MLSDVPLTIPLAASGRASHCGLALLVHPCAKHSLSDLSCYVNRRPLYLASVLVLQLRHTFITSRVAFSVPQPL